MHAAPLDRDAVLAEEVDDILRGDGAEELALLGGLAPLLEAERLDALAQRLGVALHAIGLGVGLHLDVLEVLHVARAGAERELLGDQEVAREAVGDVAHFAPAADLGDVVEQDDFHGGAYSVAEYGSSATVRARLMAWVSWRWWRAQLPEIRRGMILPRSVTRLRRRRTSL